VKRREKVLAGIVVGFIGVLVLGLAVRSIFVKPLKKIDQETKLIREKIAKINTERREFFDAEDALKAVAQRTFGTEINEASARSGEMITKQIALAGLDDADFTRLPVGPNVMKGARQIGWSIQGKGSLEKTVNLLFLLQNSPHVHRIEAVSLASGEKAGEVKVRFYYQTLVLQPAPEFDPIELKPKFTLESPERIAYNTILERDLLRPYIKAPPPPVNRKGEPGPSSAPAGPEALKVVSLSEWEGQPEVHIRDTAKNVTTRYRPGDKLKDMEIVAVDYRALPSSRSPLLVSHSRVILKIGEEYWAVERGESLAQKRKLEAEQWPPRGE
jgi:hypothetical protein